MKEELSINIEEIEGKIILRLEGRLDAQTSSILEKQLKVLLEQDYKRVLLDFSCVEYLSSAGIRLLLSYNKQFKGNKGKLIIFSIVEEVMEIIRLAGFEKLFNICQNEKEALIEK